MTKKERQVVEQIRRDWAINDAKRDENLKVPEEIEAFYDISYGDAGRENLLDIYMKKGTEGNQPVIVNVHGGAWVYGCKEIYKFYCMSLALRGFTVVNFNYRLAPESVFPAAVEDINKVMEFIVENGREYHIDKDRMFLVGDSAGAHLASLYTAIYSNERLASLYDFKVPQVTICAQALNCGAYMGRDMLLGINDFNDISEKFMIFVGRSHDEVEEELIKRLDIMDYIDSAYPPAFIMTAYDDFMFPNAEPMYKALIEKGADAELRIYGSRDRQDLGHVFHVNCNLKEASECNDDECEFFSRYIKKS